MTERKRPWWMLHWPSWLALVVFGGAFVLANTLVRDVTEVGWPMTFAEPPDNAKVPFITTGIWATGIRRRSFSAIALLVNLLVSWLCVAGGVAFVEARCKSLPRLSVGSMLGLCVACGIFFLVLSKAPFLVGYEPEQHGIVAQMLVLSAIWWIVPIAAFLASLAVLDFIGWLFSRLKQGT